MVQPLSRARAAGPAAAAPSASATHRASDALADLTGVSPRQRSSCRPTRRPARLRKGPEEVALHAEAARITDAMLGAGTALVEDALAAGGELPSEAELAAHVGRVGAG